MKFKEIQHELNESSMARIWQHITNENSTFGVMSAFRSNLSPEENKARHEELKNELRKNNLGYIEVEGAYREKQTGKMKDEASLFIPNVSRIQMISFGQKYDQDSVLYKDESAFQMIGTNKDTGIGKVMLEFKTDKDTMTFNQGFMKDFYSSLKKGSHAKRKFLFGMK